MYTESFKDLCLNPHGFYLIKLPLRSSLALIKYYIKPIGMTKTKGFRQNVFAA